MLKTTPNLPQRKLQTHHLQLLSHSYCPRSQREAWGALLFAPSYPRQLCSHRSGGSLIPSTLKLLAKTSKLSTSHLHRSLNRQQPVKGNQGDSQIVKRPWCSCWKKNRSASPALKKSSIIYFNQEFPFPPFHWLLGNDEGNSITQIVIQEHERSNLHEKSRSVNKLKAGCSPWTSHGPSTLQVSSGDRMEGTAMSGTPRITLHILGNPQDG